MRGWRRADGVGIVDLPPDLGEGSGGAATDQADRGGTVYLGQLPDGPITVLSGAGAVLYRALVAPGDNSRPGQAEDAERVRRVARDLGVGVADVDPQAITEFADELEAAGLLTRTDERAND